MVASYSAVRSNAARASMRRDSSVVPPAATWSHTAAYWAGELSTVTRAKFLAAARSRATPPPSIFSTASSQEASLGVDRGAALEQHVRERLGAGAVREREERVAHGEARGAARVHVGLGHAFAHAVTPGASPAVRASSSPMRRVAASR